MALNAKLLIRAGFIDKLMAGVYTFLPLGYRVLAKIENIIRSEMDKIGQEILMPALSPKKNWQQTGRLESVDVLFSAKGANAKSQKLNSAEYVLNSTHEEIITPLIKKFVNSYKDLPTAVYQIQSKFRNEARPKSGLLRGREFRMKDLYSFHKSEAELKKYYEQSKQAYTKVFERLGIGKDTFITLASGGDFTKDYSHEFQTKCETGEDLIFQAKSINICYNREIAPSRAPKLSQKKESFKELKEVHGKGIITVAKLAKFLDIPASQTTKTMIYKTDKGDVVAAAVRGNYDINEEKLTKVLSCRRVELATPEEIKKITGAAVGYAGLLNLPKEVKIIMDESIDGRINMEMGANKTDYHLLNVNFGRDIKKPKKFYDIKVAQNGDLHPETGEAYEVWRGAEVGNIFPLNTKFSKAFDYYYTDKNGKKKIIYMGSYGIGPSRLMGVIAEKFSDEKGLIWPEQVAPFKVHLLSLNQNKEADKIYQNLATTGIEVLYDDREDISAGEKFAGADLIGCPYRLVVSAKTLKTNSVELKKRSSEKFELLKIEELAKKLK